METLILIKHLAVRYTLRSTVRNSITYVSLYLWSGSQQGLRKTMGGGIILCEGVSLFPAPPTNDNVPF